MNHRTVDGLFDARTRSQSPDSIISSLLRLIEDPDDVQITQSESEPATPSPRETGHEDCLGIPLPGSTSLVEFCLKAQPLEDQCAHCGTSLLQLPSSTVALFAVAVQMAPSTRSHRSPPSPSTQPAPTTNRPSRTPRPATASSSQPKSRVTTSRQPKRKPSSAIVDDQASPTSPSPPTAANLDNASEPVPIPAIKLSKRKGKAPVPIDPPTIASATDETPSGFPSDDVAADVPTTQPAGPSTLTASDTDIPRSMSDVLKENASLKKFKALWIREQQEKNRAIQQGHQAPTTSSPALPPDNSIVRPPGERGKNGWNMQTALKLEQDGDAYNAILATTRESIKQAGLDWKIKFDAQDTDRLAACYSQMRRAHPYLKAFAHNWACRELVIGNLQNRRKAESAKLKAASAPKKDSGPTSRRNGYRARSTSTALTRASPSSPIDDE